MIRRFVVIVLGITVFGCDADRAGEDDLVVIADRDMGSDIASRDASSDAAGQNDGDVPDVDALRADIAVQPDVGLDRGTPDMGSTPMGKFCRAGWCWVQPGLLGSNLTDVWGSSASDVWVVGEGGAILHFDGSDWGLVDTDFTADLQAVRGASASDVWAAGRRGAIVRYDGVRWREVTSPTSDHLNDIWVNTASDVWFAGGHQTLLHWNGTSLELIESQKTVQAFTALWGSGKDDIRVGGEDNFLKRYNGTTWEWADGALTSYGAINDLWGSGPNDIWATGSNEVTRWDGTYWNPVNWTDWLNPGTIVGTGPNDVWLLGGYNTVHWDGVELTKANELEEEFLWGSWLDGAGSGYAVGPSGRIIQLVAGKWEHVSGVTRGVYGGNGDIHARTDHDVWVAARDKALHYDGTTWTEVAPATTSYFQPFSTIWSPGPKEAWAAGWGSAPNNIQRFNGTAFEPVTRSDSVNYVNAIWGTASNNVYFVGNDASILRWNGTVLEVVFYNVASIGMYNDVHGSAADNVWVVGSNGGVMHFDGKDWTPRPIMGADDLGEVLVLAPNDVWAADFWSTHLYRYDGQVWSEVEAPAVESDINGNRAIRTLFGTSNDLWAAGSGGNVFHWDGQTWTRVANFGVSIGEIDGSPSALWAVGSSHAILRRPR